MNETSSNNPKARWKKTIVTCLLLAGAGWMYDGVGSQLNAADPTGNIIPAQMPAAKSVLTLSLDDAVTLAMERQPAIAAARASRNAAITAREAAYAPFTVLSGPQIYTRRKQADMAVQISEANVIQVELETINAVTRSYIAVLFAREQQGIAEDALAVITTTRDAAKSLVEKGSPEVTKTDLDRLDTYKMIAETKFGEARTGVIRAKAALREAIGLDRCTEFEIGTEKLSHLHDAFVEHCNKKNVTLSCKKAVCMAIEKRPELIQSSLLAQITGLERRAQGWTLSPYARTYAATGDIHTRILPATVINGDYKPGPVGPEMPSFLAGSRSSRQQRATLFYERSLSVSDKAENLVALEVEEACARLKEQLNQVQLLLEATKKSKKLADDAMKIYREDQLSTEKLLAIQLLDAQTRVQLNEAYYKFGQALGLLQRATAGQLWSCFE